MRQSLGVPARNVRGFRHTFMHACLTYVRILGPMSTMGFYWSIFLSSGRKFRCSSYPPAKFEKYVTIPPVSHNRSLMAISKPWLPYGNGAIITVRKANSVVAQEKPSLLYTKLHVSALADEPSIALDAEC